MNFNKVYSEYHRMVLSYMLQRINDQMIAEELTNDIFMKVHKHLDNYDSEKSKISTWIMNISKNTLIDYYRKKKVMTVSIDQSAHGDTKTFIKDTLPTETLNPHKEMVSNEISESIYEAIDSLSDKHRPIAEMYFLEDLSYEEIRQRLNVPLNTVKGMLFRVRKVLVKKLATVRA